MILSRRLLLLLFAPVVHGEAVAQAPGAGQELLVQNVRLEVRVDPPMAGLSVELVNTGVRKQTDGSGRAVFALAAGDYVVRVHAAGRVLDRPLLVRAYEQRVLEVALPPGLEPPTASRAVPRDPPPQRVTRAPPVQVEPVAALPARDSVLPVRPDPGAALAAVIVHAPMTSTVRLPDGAALGTAAPGRPLSVLLPPGRAQLVVYAEGHVPDTLLLEAAGGTRVEVHARPTPVQSGSGLSSTFALIAATAAALAAAGLLLRRPAPPALPGEIITGSFDRYLITAQLGRGGMATVYRARDPRGQFVALKVLDAAYTTDPEALKKFLREGRVLEMLNQRFPAAPIVRVHEYGTERGDPQGRPFLCMELLSGLNLLGYMLQRGGILAPAEAAAIAARIAEGLAAAHACRIYHRDLTPDNVFVIPGDPPDIRLIDFGVARNELTRMHTLDGSIFGKPAYMAPEQCRGEPVDGRADLYSLGIMLFTMLTGNAPFNDRNPIAVMRMHELAPVPLLPEWIPGELRSLVSQLLQKEPAARPYSAVAVVERLRHCVEAGV